MKTKRNLFVLVGFIISVSSILVSCDLARITALAPPTAAFSVDKTACEAPCTITITNTSSNALNYQWDFGNGQSSALQNPDKITYTVPGIYTIQLVTSGEEGSSDTTTVVINISSEPIFADFSYTSDNNNFIPSTITFTNKSSVNAVEYLWNFGDPSSGNNNTSTAKNPSHLFNAPGTYIVSLTAKTARNVVAVKKDTLILKYQTFALQFGQGLGESVFQTIDNGYLVGTNSGWIKVDQAGKEQWRFTPSVTSFDTPKALQAANGDYYFAYRHLLSSVAKPKIRITRLNSSGTFLKQQDINSTETADDYLGDLIINRNQELILYGVFYSGSSSTTTKYFARRYKLDLALSSNPSSQNSVPDSFPISGVELIHASNGNYIGIQSIFLLLGFSNQLFSIGSSTTSYQWTQSISDVSGLSDLVQAPSGGIFLAGRKKTGTPHLSKHTLGTGVLENAKDFGYPSSSFTRLIYTPNNQLLACGNGDVFLTKIDPNTFNEIWRKPSSAFSGSSASGVANTKDGGYIIVGSIKVGPNSNVYLIKTDPNGNL